MNKIVEEFIKKAIKKPGALSRQLGIPIERDIPMDWLKTIIAAKAGETVTLNSKKIKVTRLLEQRAILAKTLKLMALKKKRGF